MAECLVPLMDGAEKFAFDVLAQRREFGLIGVALDCMDISEEWITFEDINRENNVFTCHRSLFAAEIEEQLELI